MAWILDTVNSLARLLVAPSDVRDVSSRGGSVNAGATTHVFPLMRDDGSYVSSATGAGFTGAPKRPAEEEVSPDAKSQKTSVISDAIQTYTTSGKELDALATRMRTRLSPDGQATFYSVDGTELDDILERVCNNELVPNHTAYMTLSDERKEAPILGVYADKSSQFNRTLRGGFASPMVYRGIAALVGAIDKHGAVLDVCVLYRGVQRWANFRIGDTICEPGVMSKSPDLGIVESFAGSDQDTAALFVIHYPCATKQLFFNEREREVISYPGESFRVTDVGLVVFKHTHHAIRVYLLTFVGSIYPNGRVLDALKVNPRIEPAVEQLMRDGLRRSLEDASGAPDVYLDATGYLRLWIIPDGLAHDGYIVMFTCIHKYSSKTKCYTMLHYLKHEKDPVTGETHDRIYTDLLTGRVGQLERLQNYAALFIAVALRFYALTGLAQLPRYEAASTADDANLSAYKTAMENDAVPLARYSFWDPDTQEETPQILTIAPRSLEGFGTRLIEGTIRSVTLADTPSLVLSREVVFERHTYSTMDDVVVLSDSVDLSPPRVALLAPPRYVGLYIVVGREELLVHRRSQFLGHYICSPGGSVDFGESPRMAAARETEEETGVRTSDRIYPFFVSTDGSFVGYCCFMEDRPVVRGPDAGHRDEIDMTYDFEGVPGANVLVGTGHAFVRIAGLADWLEQRMPSGDNALFLQCLRCLQESI